MEQCVFRFDELRQEHNDRVGKKCANLGELTYAGFRVPPGFATTLDAYSWFMNGTGLKARIEEFLGTFEADQNKVVDMPQFDAASKVIRQMVNETPMPKELEATVREYYDALCETTGVPDTPVATRSAGPASHPGQYESYLHVSGASEVVRNVVRVWSSTLNTRSLIARARLGLSLAYDPIGVAVLAMVNARAAGVMFTVNPTDGDPDKIYIESNWGLGESVVAGEVTPDGFLVDNATREIVRRTISPKDVWFVVDPETGTPSFQKVPDDKRDAPSLSDEEIVEISRLGKLVEDHFGVPQDLEWAVDSRLSLPESIYLLQTRPVTTKVEKKSTTDQIIDLMMRRM